MQTITIEKGLTVVVPVSLGFNVSQDVFISDIRAEADPESEIIASWDISFETDGKDGELLLTLDQDTTAAIIETTGWMDLIRVSGEEPVPVLTSPLEVVFLEPE